MNTILARLVLIVSAILVFVSCDDNRWSANIESVDYSPQTLRLDKAVFHGDKWQGSGLDSLHQVYGQFLEIYLTEIMQIGSVDNPMTKGLLEQFSSDPTWRELQEIVENRFPNTDDLEKKLGKAFKRYTYFFNEEGLPQIIAYNSGYNVGIYPSDDYLGIGLEWYAGPSHEIVKMLPPDLFPQYKRDDMRAEYLTSNALKGWLLFKYSEANPQENLLQAMIFSGKIHFVAKVLLEEPNENLLNFTDNQIGWCEKNEYDVWKHFLEGDLLFSNDPKTINKIMNNGPFTPGMPLESPGGVGNWVGLRMVETMMDEREELSLADLMEIKNEREFLKYYKPGL